MYQASTYLPRNILILLYNSLVNSKLIYCLESWGNAPKTHLNKLYIIQKRLLRIIYHTEPNYHTAPLFKKSNILPIHLLYKHRICLLAHNEFYIQHQSKLPGHSYPTRHSALSLPLPVSTSACGHRQVAYQVANCWNSLPNYLREMRGMGEFGRALRQHLLDSLT